MNSYIGQTPVFGDFPFEILTGDGANFYELSFKTSGTNGLLVFLNGAVQRPGIDFTCNGNALVFSANVSVGVQIFVYGMGLPKSSLSTSAGSVGLAELSNEVRSFGSDSQDWTNVLKLLTPKGLDDSLKGGNQLLATNGYQKLPGGLIIQWGSVSVISGTVSIVTLPVAFPNDALSATLGAGGTGTTANRYVAFSAAPSATQLLIISSGSAATVRWIAIGY